jgi:hypothetical protein
LGGFEVGGTGLDSHPMAVFGISREEYSVYILRQLIVSQKNWL